MTTVEDKRLDAMEEKLITLSNKMDKVLEVITGDDFGLNGGIVAEVKHLRDRVTKLETLKNRVMYMSLGAGSALGISLNKIIQWIQEASK